MFGYRLDGMTQTIRTVVASELEQAMTLYRACARYHAQAGIFQWDETYPSREVVAEDIEGGYLYGLFEGERCLGVVALNHDEPVQYAELEWQYGERYMIVHRLCTCPEQQRKGFARRLMAHAEDEARGKGWHSIRLDTYSPNKGAVRFYLGLGYEYRGEVQFEKRRDSGYTCFEKSLTKKDS